MCQNYRLDLDKRQSKPAINLSAPQSSNIIPGKVNTNQQEPITVHLIVSFPPLSYMLATVFLQGAIDILCSQVLMTRESRRIKYSTQLTLWLTRALQALCIQSLPIYPCLNCGLSVLNGHRNPPLSTTLATVFSKNKTHYMLNIIKCSVVCHFSRKNLISIGMYV